MSSENKDGMPMVVWCPLIPPEELGKLVGFENELGRINSAYDDWKAAMRGKSLADVESGVFLDRIRMLMIKVGIASGHNRALAQRVQIVLSDALRRKALTIVKKRHEKFENRENVRKTVVDFFDSLKFTRDIYPIEEVRKVVHGSLLSNHEDIAQEALAESTNIIKQIYIRLLSIDPWGW